MALIVGILKAANHRRCGTDEFGKLSLGKARPGPQLENLARDLFVRSGLVKVPQSCRLTFIKPAVKNLHRVGGGLGPLGHLKPPRRCATADSSQTASSSQLRD